MYLIAGLGNPGKQYEATRHNMGFDTVDCLVEKHNIPQGGVKFNAMYGKSIIWSLGSFVSAKRAVQADITGSRISSAALELKNLSASVLVSVQNRKTGIWQILCWVIFRTVIASLWMKGSMMRQRLWR